MTFFNIFSKKETKEKEKNIIIADNREKNSLVISELISLNNKVNFEQLAVGDYLINSVAIERKTLSDLKNSIIDKRIFSQLNNLKQYPEHLLIIEENSSQNYKAINESMLRGVILSISLKFKVPIIFSKDEKDTAKYLSLIASKKQNKNESIRLSKKPESKKEQIQFILEGLPKIGPVKAKQLIGEFKTIRNIANASKEDLGRVIGKSAEEIYNLFNEEFTMPNHQ